MTFQSTTEQAASTGRMYLLMVDYGRDREAVCNPEHTRRQIVSEVRDILNNSRGRSVAFIKFIDGNFIEDVTEEIVSEAQRANIDDLVSIACPDAADRQAWAFDHARALRNEGAV